MYTLSEHSGSITRDFAGASSGTAQTPASLIFSITADRFGVILYR